MAQALEEGKPVPPIEVYRLGLVYFVQDGNHVIAEHLRTLRGEFGF